MSLFCLKTHDLTWQDRTINVEFMMAPTRSTLMYNKHKSLTTKYQQEYSNLERERNSFLRSYQTEKRLMERRKDNYVRSKNDIILRRRSAETRRQSLTSPTKQGRKSAPPRLQTENETVPDSVFMTQIGIRQTKSADTSQVEPYFGDRSPRTPTRTPTTTPTSTSATTTTFYPASGKLPGNPTPGQPHFSRSLHRQKSVRFQNTISEVKPPENPILAPGGKPLTLDERIQNFLKTQKDFNKRPASFKVQTSAYQKQTPKTTQCANRYSGLSLNMIQLENAFDNFASETSEEGFQKLIKYASKMKATVKNARNQSMIPSIASLKSKKAFQRRIAPKTAWTTENAKALEVP